MTTPADAPPPPAVKPDPRRPWKAVAAAVAAAVAILLDYALPMPEWATIALTVVGAGAAAYVTKNPLVDRRKGKGRRSRRRHPGAF